MHVGGNGGRAKVWLAPRVEIAHSRGYTRRHHDAIIRKTKEHRREWLRAWDRYFGSAC